MSTDQQSVPVAHEPVAAQAPPLQEGGNETVTEPIQATAAGTATEEEEPAHATPSSPKQGSTLLANLPQFLKKTFEKKHEGHAPTEPADPVVTETSDEAADSHPDKTEKRLSRTLMDLFHKKPADKPDTHFDSVEVVPEGHEEQAAAEVTGASPPKEPIIDHLRKLFAKKPTDASAASPPAEDTTAPEGTNVTETDDHPTVPTDLPTAEEAKPVPLSRRLSKMAQTLTSRIKETNKKQQPKAAVEEEEPTVINETAAVPEVTPAPLPGANPSLPVPASA